MCEVGGAYKAAQCETDLSHACIWSHSVEKQEAKKFSSTFSFDVSCSPFRVKSCLKGTTEICCTWLEEKSTVLKIHHLSSHPCREEFSHHLFVSGRGFFFNLGWGSDRRRLHSCFLPLCLLSMWIFCFKPKQPLSLRVLCLDGFVYRGTSKDTMVSRGP